MAAAKKPHPEETKELVPATPLSVIQAELPEFMRDEAVRGTEGLESTDLEIPRLKLIQSTSPEVTERDDVRAGQFWHVAEEHAFKGPFLVTPILVDRRYTLWRPLEDGGGILARADDGSHWTPSHGEFTVKLDKKDGGHTVVWKMAPTVKESGLGEWGTMNPSDSNSPPAATISYNFLVAFPEHLDLSPAVLSFQRSSVKVGRQFNTKLRVSRAPIFGTVWQLAVVEDHNNAGQKFYNIRLTGAGMIGDKALYDQYKLLHQAYSKTGLRIRDDQDLQYEGDIAGSAEDATAGKHSY